MNGPRHLQNKTTLANMYDPSPAIWGTCPLPFIKKYYPQGYLRWSARDFPLIGTQTTQISGGFPPGTKGFASTDGGIVPVSAINSVEKWGGAISFTGGTDNHSASLAQVWPQFRISGLPSTSNRLWFEACVAISSIAVSTAGFFVGLAETELWTLATGVPFNAGDAITNSASAIGWRKGEDALGAMDTVYSDRATSFTVVGDDTASIAAAYTFVNIGFTYDPGPGKYYDASRIIRFFKDNIEQSNAISKTTLTGLTNLDANALGPIYSHITDTSGTTTISYLAWLECAQLPPLINP